MSQEVSLLVSTEGLHGLSDMALATKEQTSFEQLLAKNAEGSLSNESQEELNKLLKRIDELNLVKARAAVALGRLMSDG